MKKEKKEKKSVTVLAAALFIVSVLWLLVVVSFEGHQGISSLEQPPAASGNRDTGVVRLTVVSPPNHGGAFVTLNVLEKNGG